MSSKLTFPLRVLALLALLAAWLTLPASASATTYSMKWNRSVPLENPNAGGALESVSCAPVTRTVKPVLMCAAGDVRGDIWVTSHPARSVSFWHREQVDRPGGAVTGIACPSLKLCVAVDASGEIMHSTTPEKGAKFWSKPVRIDTATQPGGGDAGFSAISCPTTRLCVAVDNASNGQIAYTTNPAGPAKAWTLVGVGRGVMLDSVACANAALCLIGGNERLYSTNPTGGAGAWKATGSLSSSAAVIAALACNTAQLCVGVGYGNAGAGLATASPTPALGASAWTGALIGTNPPSQGAQLLDGVGCPHRNFCVAVDGASNAYVTSTPVRGNWSLAKPLKSASQATLSAISCNAAICVDVDNRGTVTYGSVGIATATKSSTKTSSTTTTTKTTG